MFLGVGLCTFLVIPTKLNPTIPLSPKRFGPLEEYFPYVSCKLYLGHIIKYRCFFKLWLLFLVPNLMVLMASILSAGSLGENSVECSCFRTPTETVTITVLALNSLLFLQRTTAAKLEDMMCRSHKLFMDNNLIVE